MITFFFIPAAFSIKKNSFKWSKTTVLLHWFTAVQVLYAVLKCTLTSSQTKHRLSCASIVEEAETLSHLVLKSSSFHSLRHRQPSERKTSGLEPLPFISGPAASAHLEKRVKRAGGEDNKSSEQQQVSVNRDVLRQKTCLENDALWRHLNHKKTLVRAVEPISSFLQGGLWTHVGQKNDFLFPLAPPPGLTEP